MSARDFAAGVAPQVRLAHLLAEERRLLVEYLRELAEPEWKGETLCAEWDVRQVAVHLLGTDEDVLSLRTGLRMMRAARGDRARAVEHFAAANRDQQERHRDEPPGEVLRQLERGGRRLERRLSRLPSSLWERRIGFFGARVPLSTLLSSLLVNAWVHRQDILRPRGIAPGDDREQLEAIVPTVMTLVFLLGEYRPSARVGLDLGWAGRWHVAPGAAGFASRPAEGADATVRLEPGAFVLTATGRLRTAKDAGAKVAGDRAAAAAFVEGLSYLGRTPGF